MTFRKKITLPGGETIRAAGTLNRRTVSERILYAIVFVVFAFFAFTYLYVIFWCLVSGMRSNAAIATSPFGFTGWQPRNYIDVFTMLEVNHTTFLGMIGNSLFFSFLGPAITILTTCTFAYVTTKYRFPTSRWWFYIVLITMTLPIYSTQGAQYRLLYKLRIVNTRWMLLTSIGGVSVYYMYFRAFFEGLSWSYAEAAEIDGANDWQIFFRVMFPQSLVMSGSLFLLLWMADWNNYGNALVYLPKMPTIAVGIYLFNSDMMHLNRMDILYAACFISLLPPLILFILCNNALMGNVSLGGIKE